MRTFQAVLASSLPVDSTGRAQLLPAGEFAARDGRPGPGRKWKLSDARGVALAAAISAVAALTPVVIDYDHQTLYVQQNGQQAPASGWIKSATWQPGKGLFADVDWTARATASIDAGEYRYISPVIQYDETDQVVGVALAALTNYPALLGMEPAVTALSSQFNLHQEPDMTLLVSLLTALGLAATTTEAEALAAVSALTVTAAAAKSRPAVAAALVAELGLPATADEAAALSALKALKLPSSELAGLVATLQGQVATLTAQQDSDKVAAAVDGAIDAGKLTAGQREQYVALGKKDLAMLTAILAAAPVIPGLKGQKPAGGDPGAGSGTEALSATQALIAKQLGLDPAVYAKQLKVAA